MKKLIIILIAATVASGGCGNRQPKMGNENAIETQQDTSLLMSKMGTDDTYPEETNKITIDRSFFETEKEIKKIYYRDSEYEIYGITSFNTLGMVSYEHFVFDDTDVSFSIIAEVKLYDNIQSLIIRGRTEHTLGIWLVNYDLNKRSDVNSEFYAYIDSYPIGYDEWAESASWITSVIYILPQPYIEREYVHWENKENSKIEILKSGKFKIIQTINSKYKM